MSKIARSMMIAQQPAEVPYDIPHITANEKPIVNRTLECRLIMDPFQAKIISQWLTNHVNEYERQFGRIPSPEEIQVNAASPESANSKNTNELYQ
jgi:hypothetical protein